MDKCDDQWPAVTPDRLQPTVLMGNFSIFLHPTTHAYDVPGMHLILVTGGQLWFQDHRGRRAVASRGDLLALRSGRSRYGTIATGGLLTVYQAHIQVAGGDLARGVPSLPDRGLLPSLISCPDEHTQLCAAFERIIEALLGADPTWQLACAGAVLDILHRAFRAVGHDPAPPEGASHRWGWVAGNLEHCADDLRIADLARMLGLSREAFSRGFHRHFGCAPKRFLLQRRLWRARNLLVAGSPVKEAAVKTGFSDPLYFSRAFSRMFGYPPSRSAEGIGALPSQTLVAPLSRNLFAPGVDVRSFRCTSGSEAEKEMAEPQVIRRSRSVRPPGR